MNSSLTFLAIAVLPGLALAADPIVIDAPEQQRIDLSQPDGGLPPLPGVANVQVHRAAPPGHTYHHHADLAVWKSRLYCAWNSTERDEDTGPTRQLYSTSPDAVRWSPAEDLFPGDIATPIRVSFYLARNGRMLAIAGLRASRDPLVERNKYSLLAREIRADHTLGPVFTLQVGPRDPQLEAPPPVYSSSRDAAFVDACADLLANTNFLLQQDYGNLLPPGRRMRWNETSGWNGDRDFGKATAFYTRRDGTMVAISKKRFVVTSPDDGVTWPTPPVQPPTLVTGMAKVWPERLAEDQYVLVYNPHPVERHPLVLVSGTDGITFSRMRAVHPTFPPMRHPGLYKAPGPQYVRGVSRWSSDGSFPDKSMFVAYSVNKEDIWVARIPTPIEADPDDRSPRWNTYSPQWAPATVADGMVRLEDRDPADGAIATKVFPGRRHVRVSYQLHPTAASSGSLHVSLRPPAGAATAFQVTVGAAGHATRFVIEADCESQTYTYTVDDGEPVRGRFVDGAESLGRLTFRTQNDRPVTRESDARLDEASVFEVRDVIVGP